MATYFAPMAAFTNLVFSASLLGTKYLNSIIEIERSRYHDLNGLMITVALMTLIVPILAVVLLTPPKPANPEMHLGTCIFSSAKFSDFVR